MADYYLEHPEALQGQPKRSIADYVEQNGILVPRRFANLPEARASGLPIFVRAEHPLEYDRFSGLSDSFSLDRFEGHAERQMESADQIKQLLFDKNAPVTIKNSYGSKNLLPAFFKMSGLDVKKELERLSFSLWEKLPGINLTLIADSAVKGRYHFFEEYPSVYDDVVPENNRWGYTYFVVEDGKPIRSLVKNCKAYPKREDFSPLIEFYEQVRRLGNFDPEHCPLIEAQEVDGKIYFLQYRRARQFKPAEFELTRSLEEGEIEVPYVRGATAREGLVGKVTVAYARESNEINWDWGIQKDEFGSFDGHNNWALSGVMYPRRRLQIVTPCHGLDWELFRFAAKHQQISPLFLPEVSVIIKDRILRDPHPISGPITHEIWEKWESHQLSERARETGENQSLTMSVISDGRKAYIKRLD